MKNKKILSELKIPIILFIILTLLQFFKFAIAIDKYVEGIIYPLFSGKLVFIFSILSFTAKLKVASIITVILILILFYKGNHRGWVAIGLLFFFSIIFEVILKEIVIKPRPDLSLYRSTLEPMTKSYSYPSGHCIRAVLIYGALYEIIKRYFYEGISKFFYSYLFTTFIILICLSRVVIGAHWFTDLLGGALAGWIFFVIFRNNYL